MRSNGPVVNRPTHSVSVAGATIDEQGAVLAIRRADTGDWQLPGGVLERDETVLQGVVREVGEETGVTVRPERLTGVYKNMSLGVVALVFRCAIVAGTPSSTAEATECRWMTRAEVEREMEPAFAVRLTDALDEPHAAAVRTSDGRVLLDDA